MFWEDRPLDALTRPQWEALCDRCGRCCLEKLTDRKTGRVFYTSVPCQLLDVNQGTCRQYRQRTLAVPACQQLNAWQVVACRWLPSTCAYRRLAEGRPLAAWHPLVSGDPESVHRAGISVRNYPLHSVTVEAVDLADYIVDWGFWRRWRRPA